jgi:glycosyltransferase involved in cell wall biosynthesis
MNILSINKYFYEKGGSEAVFFSEKEMLENNGHEVIPFAMKSEQNLHSEYSEYFAKEVDYDKPGIVNKLTSASKIIFSFDARSKIKSLLDNVKVDLSHFHIFQHQISPSVFGPLRSKNVPVILTLHDLKPICPSYKYYVNGSVCEACAGRRFYNCFKNRCTKGSALGSLVNTMEMYMHYFLGYYQEVDRYIAVSKFYQKKMVEAGFPEDQISYLPNFIDVDKFDHLAEDKGYVLYFGRLSEEKGIYTYLSAAMSNSEIPHYIVGTGPLEDELIRSKNDQGADNVQFLGFKTGEALKDLISGCTCVVVPSEWYENCPMSVLEAYAAGRPVIGSNIGGIPELIEDQEDGFIFSPGNSQELAEKINWVWRNRGSAREMGQKGRERVKSKFNAEAHYRGLMDIYESVLSTK